MHEAGETARSALSIFKEQPFILALIIVILALLGLLYWNAVTAEREREKGLDLLYENRKVVTEALLKCYPAPPRKGQ